MTDGDLCELCEGRVEHRLIAVFPALYQQGGSVVSEITLNVPDALGDLPKEERDLLVGRALRGAVRDRIVQVEREVGEGETHISQFEKRYGFTFDVFERKIEAQELAGVDYQEDYNDWYAWIESTRRAVQVLEKLRKFLV